MWAKLAIVEDAETSARIDCYYSSSRARASVFGGALRESNLDLSLLVGCMTREEGMSLREELQSQLEHRPLVPASNKVIHLEQSRVKSFSNAWVPSLVPTICASPI